MEPRLTTLLYHDTAKLIGPGTVRGRTIGSGTDSPIKIGVGITIPISIGSGTDKLNIIGSGTDRWIIRAFKKLDLKDPGKLNKSNKLIVLVYLNVPSTPNKLYSYSDSRFFFLYK